MECSTQVELKKKDQMAFIRSFILPTNNKLDFFLGSGASIQSGIPTGQNLIWEFKKELYCSENDASRDLFKDLQSSHTRTKIQEYFDSLDGYPICGSLEEYSFYFEKCYDTPTARQNFIDNYVNNIHPSRGYLCLANLIIHKKVSKVWTTNFDELIESGIKTLNPAFSVNVISSANNDSLKNIDNNSYPTIYKLHGDYRYDKIMNTSEELLALETTLTYRFKGSLFNGGLVVLGYAGNDESIMSILEANIDNKLFLPQGLFWLKPKNCQLSRRVKSLMLKACKINENSCVIDIDNFDNFMGLIYKNSSVPNEVIDDRWKDFSSRKLPISFSSQNASNDLFKTNSFIAKKLPKCNSFLTDIKSFKELKTIIDDNDVIVTLYNNKIYSFEDKDTLNNVFNKHILSEINLDELPKKDLYKNDNSAYLGILYKLIKKSITNKSDIKEFAKNKYYFSSSRKSNMQFLQYDTMEINLSYYDNNCYMSIRPTYYLTDKNGGNLDDLTKQFELNKLMSSLYNGPYNEKLKEINRNLNKNHSIDFNHQDFTLSFKYTCCLASSNSNNSHEVDFKLYKYTEPVMKFSQRDSAKVGVNQLKGLVKYGPIDSSYIENRGYARHSIRLGILAPEQSLTPLLNHLSNLKKCFQPQKQDFLPCYEGFEKVYKKGLEIPSSNDNGLCITYDLNTAMQYTTQNYLNFLKQKIDYFSTQQTNFELLILYIPKAYKKFREDKSYDEDYNLHDAIKLYATDKGIKVQIIEEKSLLASDKCKVMWALSTSLYAKAAGVLWQPVTLDNDTAFVGVSYAKSSKDNICIGCSQLFDSTGTGMRLLLQKIKDPSYNGKNPYMKCDEARTTMLKLREEYYQCTPTSKLNRIVIHKTTNFTAEEIKGFTQAFEGIADIELLQIQEFSPWKAINLYNKDKNAQSFPLQRGSVLKLSDDSFLLWTHGCVKHEELLGEKLNYYKGSRGIPAPLLVKRFYGKATGDTIVKEILMLSKMNWNSGDNLYKILPVTLDFSKVLSRMSKQKEAMYDKPYDFRYFM